MSIHPTAFVEPGAVVADSADVQAFAYVGAGVTVGEYAVLLRRAGADEDVPAQWIVDGDPAEWVGCVCHCGAELPMHLYANRLQDMRTGEAFWHALDWGRAVPCEQCGAEHDLRELLQEG